MIAHLKGHFVQCTVTALLAKLSNIVVKLQVGTARAVQFLSCVQIMHAHTAIHTLSPDCHPTVHSLPTWISIFIQHNKRRDSDAQSCWSDQSTVYVRDTSQDTQLICCSLCKHAQSDIGIVHEAAMLI